MSQRAQNILWLITLALVVTVMLLVSNHCHSHEWYEPHADWFNSRKQPDSPTVSCCGLGDAYYVKRFEYTDDGIRALVEGHHNDEWWINVPAKKIGWDSPNPTTRSVIYVGVTEAGEPPYVYCFFPFSGG